MQKNFHSDKTLLEMKVERCLGVSSGWQDWILTQGYQSPPGGKPRARSKPTPFEELDHQAHQISESLQQVFSILPKSQAVEAQQKALQNYVGAGDILADQVKWGDFSKRGEFKGGGAVDIAGFSARIATNAADDPDIARLAELARDGGVKAGLMEYSVSANAVIWFLPNLSYSEDRAPQDFVRGFFVPETIVAEILDIFNDDASLTQAEKHLIFQLVAGLSLRNAAEVDSLSFETKRAQLKAVCSKLQCGGQTDLLRHVLGQMTFLVSLCDIQKHRSSEVEGFVQKYLAPDTRITVQRLSNGRTLRVLERGAMGGNPVLVIHGLLWPLLFLGAPDILKKNNIKLLVPLRSGYLERHSGQDIYGSSDMVARSLADIASYQSEYLDQKIPIVGHSYGGVLAFEYARLFPENVARMSIVAFSSVEATSANKNFIGKMFSGLQSLSNQPGIFRYLTWQFKKYYADERTVRPILQNMFGASETDRNLIDGNGEIGAVYPWFVDLYQRSIPGIADDFKLALGRPKEILTEVTADILLIHGSEDPLVESSRIEDYAASAENAEVKIIEGAGHHLFNTHGDELWESVLRHSAIDG